MNIYESILEKLGRGEPCSLETRFVGTEGRMEEGLRRSQIRSENLVALLSWRQPAFLLRSPQP